MVRAAGGADDAASPGPMCRADGGGRHDRPSDSVDSPPPASQREQSNKRPERPTWWILTSGAVLCSSARAPEDVALGDLDAVEAERRQHLRAGSTTPATIVGARSGCRPGTSRRSASGSAASRVEHARAAAPRVSTWPSTRPGRRARAPRSIAAHDVGVPATAIAASTRSRTRAGTAASSVARTSRASASSSAGVGGSRVQVALGVAHDADLRRDVEARPRRARRRRARSSRRRCRSPAAASGRRRARAVAPRKVSRASSSPLSVRASRPKRSRDRARRTRRRWRRRARPRSSPRRARSQPCALDRRARTPSSTSNTRCCGASPRRPVRVDALAEPRDDRARGRAPRRPSRRRRRSSRRVEFVPMSTTATRRHVGRVRHRLAGERGEQVVDGHLGHPRAGAHGRRADVRDDEQVRRARAAGRRRAAARGR